MSKYIQEFNRIGNSVVNVDLICKDWNNQFSIQLWKNDTEEKYTFLVKGKRRYKILCKTQISKEQAMDIIQKLDLILVKSGLLRSAGSYYSKEFIKSEIDRITQIKREKERELSTILEILYGYESCL